MGNTRRVHYACALAASVLLSGCEQPKSHDAETAGEIAALSTRVSVLEQRLTEDAAARSALGNRLQSLSDTQASLIQTFNKNVKVNNEDSARDMTRRGACGLEWVPGPNGWVQANKTCTVKDLRKP